MLFLARYTIALENMQTAMAKRIEFEELKPPGMKIICEYTAHGVSQPLSGFLVFETDDVEVLNFLVLYYGRTVELDIRACSDVLSAIAASQRSLGRMSGGELEGGD